LDASRYFQPSLPVLSPGSVYALRFYQGKAERQPLHPTNPARPLMFWIVILTLVAVTVVLLQRRREPRAHDATREHIRSPPGRQCHADRQVARHEAAVHAIRVPNHRLASHAKPQMGLLANGCPPFKAENRDFDRGCDSERVWSRGLCSSPIGVDALRASKGPSGSLDGDEYLSRHSWEAR